MPHRAVTITSSKQGDFERHLADLQRAVVQRYKEGAYQDALELAQHAKAEMRQCLPCVMRRCSRP